MTVTSADDFFSGPEFEVDRAPNGNPLIVPPEGGEPVEYSRASSLGDSIQDFAHLHRWEMRYLAKAMGQHRDLARLAAVETYSTGFDAPEQEEKTASGRRLDDIIERALDRQRIHEKADYGTAVHASTEPDNKEPVPDDMLDDVNSFKQAIADAGGRIIDTEVFVVCDELRVAGTFDHLVEFPGLGVVILDKKTGRAKYPEFGVQFSIYAHSQRYDLKTHKRTPLHEDVSDDIAVAAMIKDGKTTFKQIDITRGWERAKIAAKVRDSNADCAGIGKDITRSLYEQAHKARGYLAESLAVATTPEALYVMWRNNQHLWTPEHTEISKTRKAHLEAK